MTEDLNALFFAKHKREGGLQRKKKRTRVKKEEREVPQEGTSSSLTVVGPPNVVEVHVVVVEPLVTVEALASLKETTLNSTPSVREMLRGLTVVFILENIE